jgi:lipopolysaccharide transport system permease protein
LIELFALKRGVIKIFKALWGYRGFIFGLVARDFHARYLNSLLGSLWALFNPLSQILIYTLVFSQVMRAKLPGIDDVLGYSIYLCAGIIPWGYFAEALGRSQGIFIEQANLLKKVSFPRTTLPVYIFLSAGINFGLIFFIFIGFLALTGRMPGWPILAIIPLIIIQQGIALGLGVFFGTLNVFFRDVGQAMGIILQFWFWLTPIVYPLQAVPEKFYWLFSINPMYPVICSYQNIFLTNQWPLWQSVLPAVIWSILSLLIGYVVFMKLDKEMVDEL